MRTGRKWQAQEAVDQAEARSRHSVLVGTVAVGRAGLEVTPGLILTEPLERRDGSWCKKRSEQRWKRNTTARQ